MNTTTKKKIKEPVAEYHFYVRDPDSGEVTFLVAIAQSVSWPVRGSYHEPSSGGMCEDIDFYLTDGEEGPIVGDWLDDAELKALRVDVAQVEDKLYEIVCESADDGCGEY